MDVAFDVNFAKIISHFGKIAYKEGVFCANIRKNNEDRVAFSVIPDCSEWLATRFFMVKYADKTEQNGG